MLSPRDVLTVFIKTPSKPDTCWSKKPQSVMNSILTTHQIPYKGVKLAGTRQPLLAIHVYYTKLKSMSAIIFLTAVWKTSHLMLSVEYQMTWHPVLAQAPLQTLSSLSLVELAISHWLSLKSGRGCHDRSKRQWRDSSEWRPSCQLSVSSHSIGES